MSDEKKYEKGYKKFIEKAKAYADNPQKTLGLLEKSSLKAKDNKTSLSGIWDKFQLLMDLVKSWSGGEYKAVSKKSIIFIIAAILYFVSPIDMIPDFLIGLGIVDDAAVLTFAIKQISDELEKYKDWKQKKPLEID